MVMVTVAAVPGRMTSANSPMLPADGLSLVEVPAIPAVEVGVINPEAPRVVTKADAAAVAPNVPFRAEPDAVVLFRVVNAPVDAEPLPIAPGEANVAPLSDDAFRLATFVVDAITSGAVPVVTVDVICPLAETVVNFPDDAAVPPIAGGEANKAVKPAPETVLLAAKVVNAPVDGAVLPIAEGDARSAANPAPETVPEAASVVTEAVPPDTFVAVVAVVALPTVSPAAVPVTLVITPEVGVPRAGATSVLLESVSG